MANNDLLLEIMDLIEHPEKMPAGTRWNQNDWFRQDVSYTIDEQGKDVVHVCGTSFCFAGWAVYLDGFTEYVPPEKDKNGVTWDEGRLRNPQSGECLDPTQVQNRATDLLDLDSLDADVLFEAGNTKENLRDYVTNLVNGDALSEPWEDEEDED